MIKGKTPEEIRKLFNIVNDFTPEEEVRCCFSPRGGHELNMICYPGPDQEGECESRFCAADPIVPNMLSYRNGRRIAR